MSKRAKLPQTSRHVPIYNEDWEFAKTYWGQGSGRELGPGPAVREIVHLYIKSIRAKQEQQLDVEGLGL